MIAASSHEVQKKVLADAWKKVNALLADGWQPLGAAKLKMSSTGVF